MITAAMCNDMNERSKYSRKTFKSIYIKYTQTMIRGQAIIIYSYQDLLIEKERKKLRMNKKQHEKNTISLLTKKTK